MKHTRTSVAPSSKHNETKQRRQFMKLMSAGAAGLALQACGGGGSATAGTSQGGPAPSAETGLPPSTATGGNSGPSALVPASAPPVWTTVPTLTFTQGVASTISISKYVKSSNGGPLAIALNSIALPPGVTYNARTLSFVYDGIGAVGSTEGHVLTASDI